MSFWSAPPWVKTFHSKFPLVTLEQDDVLDWHQEDAKCSLWVSDLH
jgi:hypothetical protein